MLCLGVDIGTTTISAVIADNVDGVKDVITIKNEAYLPNKPIWENSQQPEIILEKTIQVIDILLSRHPKVDGIGLTGQMHGIVYLDETGNSVSPLYTWQDERGNLIFDATDTYSDHLSQLTGYPIAAGYGMVTHFYNLSQGLVPKKACCFCTIGDYVAMKLAGLHRPMINASNAASFGLFDLVYEKFDQTAMKKAGIDPNLLPAVSRNPILGNTGTGLPVMIAIGDNQASFLGASQGNTDCVLVNIGTGSQVSIYSESPIRCPGLEIRPFPLGGYLLVGATLCGGRAYALLERFFREIVKNVTGNEVSCYAAMQQMLDLGEPVNDYPKVITTFAGTRQDPDTSGSFTGVTVDNMTPLHWIYGVLHGIANELYEMYQGYLSAGGSRKTTLIGSGNGLRQINQLSQIISEKFEYPVIRLSENIEDAAYGAAQFAFQGLTK